MLLKNYIEALFLVAVICAAQALGNEDELAALNALDQNEQMAAFNSYSEQQQLGENSLTEGATETPMIKPIDLCLNKKCGIGEQCAMFEGEAFCECIEICEVPTDPRQKICTSSNQTFESDCHFLRMKCWCNRNDPKCRDLNIINERLDYYGACQHIEECSEEQKKVFPQRMKIWLDEVLHILNERKDLDPKFSSLVKLADEMKANNTEKFWTYGVAFEFCQLDKSNDHIIQKDEVRSLISSIKSMENCIQPFLDECDTNNDDIISDREWGVCLGLMDHELELLRQYC